MTALIAAEDVAFSFRRRIVLAGVTLEVHASEVVVPLYPRREPIRVTAPVPEHMRERLAGCGCHHHGPIESGVPRPAIGLE